MGRAVESSGDAADVAGPPRAWPRHGFTRAVAGAVSRRSPLVVPLHIAEGAIRTLGGLLVTVTGIVLLLLTMPSAGDDAAAAAFDHRRAVVGVAAQTTRTTPTGRTAGEATIREARSGTTGTGEVEIRYAWTGREVRRVVSDGALASARVSAGGPEGSTVLVWVTRGGGILSRAPVAPEQARLQAVAGRMVLLGALLLTAATSSRALTTTFVRARCRSWDREWQRRNRCGVDLGTDDR